MSIGSGTRLWPLSTQARPKQFHDLGADRPIMVETTQRLSGSHGDLVFLDPVIIANTVHAGIVQSLLAQGGVTPSAIVLEPVGRNTAATAALAALIAREIDPEAHVLLAPADHLVGKPDALISAIRVAMGVVAERVVTFGIKPTGPETGYGYILQGEELRPGVNRLVAFKEKPDRPQAERYLRDGGYTWNSGLFFFAPALLLEEFSIASADIRDGAAEALATLLDCSNSLVRSDGLQVSVIGAEDMVVIASGNSVLIMPRSRAQDVKKVIPSQK